jgi:hypothetical protein
MCGYCLLRTSKNPRPPSVNNVALAHSKATAVTGRTGRDWTKQLMMSFREKILYHQIHPTKIVVDVASGLLSTWLVWTHALVIGMTVAWVPTILASAIMLWRLDFSRQRDSALGRYVAFHMTRVAEAVRMTGQIGMWICAWYHAAWAIAASALVIIFGWTYSIPNWRARAH